MAGPAGADRAAPVTNAADPDAAGAYGEANLNSQVEQLIENANYFNLVDQTMQILTASIARMKSMAQMQL